MPRLFAVTRSRGPAWRAERPMEEQDEWQSHAVFMTGLAQPAGNRGSGLQRDLVLAGASARQHGEPEPSSRHGPGPGVPSSLPTEIVTVDPRGA